MKFNDIIYVISLCTKRLRNHPRIALRHDSVLGRQIWRGSTAGKNFSSDDKKSQTIHLKTFLRKKMHLFLKKIDKDFEGQKNFKIFSSQKKKIEIFFFCFSNVFKWIVWLFFSSDENFFPAVLPLQIRLPSSETWLKPPIRNWDDVTPGGYS